VDIIFILVCLSMFNGSALQNTRRIPFIITELAIYEG